MLLWGCLLVEGTVTAARAQEHVDLPVGLSEAQLAPIRGIVEKAIRTDRIPGAVVLIGNQGKVVYRHAFGHRAIER
jgi:CubicO group peptidase (beta-lactamase class C family)